MIGAELLLDQGMESALALAFFPAAEFSSVIGVDMDF